MDTLLSICDEMNKFVFINKTHNWNKERERANKRYDKISVNENVQLIVIIVQEIILFLCFFLKSFEG